jgi:hypothetical protein
MQVQPIFSDVDVGSVIQIALVLLFVFGPVLLRLLGLAERQADRTLPEPPGPSDVDEEIEDFLRRSQGQGEDEASPDIEVIHPRPRPIRPQPAVQLEVDLEIAGEEDTAGAAEPQAAAPAAGRLLARLRTPKGMRDAILLREILQRPEQRW